MTENIEPASPAPPAFTPEEEFTAYRQGILLIRRFEEKAGQMYGMGLIAGFCHRDIGGVRADAPARKGLTARGRGTFTPRHAIGQ